MMMAMMADSAYSSISSTSTIPAPDFDNDHRYFYRGEQHRSFTFQADHGELRRRLSQRPEQQQQQQQQLQPPQLSHQQQYQQQEYQEHQPYIARQPPRPSFGYRWLLGDAAHHFGYWDKDTWWPFPLGPHLRTMQEKLHAALALPVTTSANAPRVLDAGCGAGHAALYMAQQGVHVTAIDIASARVARAQRRLARAGLVSGGQATVRRMDMHHLETVLTASHDGVYTMETLRHSANPEAVMASFFRILKPGGRYKQHDYCCPHQQQHHHYPSAADLHTRRLDLYQQMLEDAGFVDVVVTDLSDRVRPMLRYLYVLAAVPAFLVRCLGLRRCFPAAAEHSDAAARLYGEPELYRYVQISATKPLRSAGTARVGFAW
ncbi:S-adenosyl-L-methionine-dependent methyltransferase [Lasiosphaeria miniovina]|uniref:phosphoethanolamine N-methyltransferase n=1 Tax=Lasiosphaeria miniovina TaxID=1954250 RepID=A0AA40DGE0_9PEZI|nr:S-adenosyl-L-methionine-dependent methyltransferase [Lasiosphaeria miniovina]KAK0702110.1 S-adenosyl-L-methionine-dependent methyltransferase [Lasiosphaeria miniovina]